MPKYSRTAITSGMDIRQTVASTSAWIDRGRVFRSPDWSTIYVIRGVRDSHGLMVKEVDPILGPEHDQLENIIRRVKGFRVCDEHFRRRRSCLGPKPYLKMVDAEYSTSV